MACKSVCGVSAKGSRGEKRSMITLALLFSLGQASLAYAQVRDPVVTERAIQTLVTCEWPAFDRTQEENRALHDALRHLSDEAAVNMNAAQDQIGAPFLSGYAALGVQFEQIYLLGWGDRAASMSWSPRATSAELITLLEQRGHVFKPDKNRVFEGQASEQPSRQGRIRIAVAAGRHNPVKKLSDEGVTVICSSIPVTAQR